MPPKKRIGGFNRKPPQDINQQMDISSSDSSNDDLPLANISGVRQVMPVIGRAEVDQPSQSSSGDSDTPLDILAGNLRVVGNSGNNQEILLPLIETAENNNGDILAVNDDLNINEDDNSMAVEVEVNRNEIDEDMNHNILDNVDMVMADNGQEDNEQEVRNIIEEIDVNEAVVDPVRRVLRSHGSAFIVDGRRFEGTVVPDFIGRMQLLCPYCGAYLFPGEVTQRGGGGRMCCMNGRVELPKLHPCHNYLHRLITGENGEFRRYIRIYNAALSFASFEAEIDQMNPGSYVFRIHGTPYHRIGAMYPEEGQPRRNAQLYFIDNATAHGLRGEAFPRCNIEVLTEVDNILRNINPFCRAFRMVYEVEEEERRLAEINNTTMREVVMVLKNPGDAPPNRQYDVPTANEVAVIFKGAIPGNLPNIQIYLRSGHLQTITILSPQTDPLVYPLIFQRGELGYYGDIPHTDNRNSVTMREFYAYRLAIREDFNVIISCGRLTHQYIVDVWVRTECERINFVRKNQTKLRVELYSGLIDHLNRVADHERVHVGRMFILPSSFVNSPRNCYEHYMDAITIFKNNGHPSFFITFTCNPKWTEIENELRDFETANDRPDIVARVFSEKLRQLMKDLADKHILGVPLSYIYSIEFQKRGLPHAHIVLSVQGADDVHTSQDVDGRVSAEIPDLDMEPSLRRLVLRHMIHGPCGSQNLQSPCMVDGKCAKRYPKQFREATTYNPRGYPIYRRRDSGCTAVVRNTTVDNRNVVPYNPVLLMKYDAHINIEICSGQKWVKYLFKYCFKGPDCISVVLRQTQETGQLIYDECEKYLDGRYVSAPEAYWRLVGFPLVKMSHAVVKLPVHLPGQNAVIFSEDNAQDVANNELLQDTKLTAFFRLNERDHAARQYLYKEIPLHYRFEEKTKTWVHRIRSTMVAARMYDYSPKDKERYCLRLLLDTVRGPTSYVQLKTVGEEVYATFQEAAVALHLMVDDGDSIRCMEEATHYRMPAALRRLFVTICIHNNVNALNLWMQFADSMTEDFIHRRHMTEQNAKNAALMHINTLLCMHESSCALQGLPIPLEVDGIEVDGIEVDGNNDRGLMANVSSLNQQQRTCYEQIMGAVHRICNGDSISTKGFFIDGVGGSGKSFLYEAIIATVKARGETVIAVAVSGIAATLLSGGQTAHSAFKIPLNVDENTTCGISVQSKEAQYIRRCMVILWDEASMISCHMLHAVDRMLRDIMGNNTAFGGKVIVFGGDFRQTLPIVRGASRHQQVLASMKYSPLWQQLTQLRLDINMRAAEENGEFSAWLQGVGEQKLPRVQYTDADNTVHRYGEDVVEIPAQCIYDGYIEDWVFDVLDDENLYTRAVLCPKNCDVNDMNERVLGKLPGQETTYLSSNVQAMDSEVPVPVEYMQEIETSGLPPHVLNLKIGAIVMLLRNIDLSTGLCNGTRLKVDEMGEHTIKLRIITGPHKNEPVILGRLSLIPTDSAIVFSRRQYPIKLSYAMTINKAQGQTMSRVGLYLRDPVFSHGQLYVALSRAKRFADIKVTVRNTTKQGRIAEINKTVTKNVVYTELL